MTVAADLLEAAEFAQGNLQTLWVADTLQARMIAFWQAITDDFPEETPNNRPVGNWIAVIAAFSPSILDFETSTRLGVDTLATYQTAAIYIYRLCKFAYYYHADALITNAQRDAILAAYNAQFG